MADNRKTFRLEDKAQEVLTATKERRRCTENDAVNYLIEQTETQAKTITDQYNAILKKDQVYNELWNENDRLKRELAELKGAFRLIGNLFDSRPAADQAGASPGQQNG